MVEKQVDILIIGGGLTGATLMLALRNLGYSSLLVESKAFNDKTKPDFDARSLAISPASQRILTMLGLWDILQPNATPIKLIHVSEQHRFGASRLQGEKNNPLGHVIEMHYINQALHKLLPQEHILAPINLGTVNLEKSSATVNTANGDMNIKAQLIVAADGADSMVRQYCGLAAKIKNYHQVAIVANIGLEKNHHNRAYERFTLQGPLALLPMQNRRMSLVWALKPVEAERLMALNEADFLKALQYTFGYRLGRFIKMGKRASFPLKQVLMAQQIKWPIVFVGNAAHTLHPVAGQGFNLGLRDVATLAQCIAADGLTGIMLEHYAHFRAHDQQIIGYLTDGLIQLFTSRIPGVALARDLGLIALDNIPALKNLLARYAQGFGGMTPDLVCEIALTPRSIE